MSEENIAIEFKYPWAMMPLESAGEWIEAVTKSLLEKDPLYRKEIFVSGRHELKNLILVDNDTENNYAILAYAVKEMDGGFDCKTVEIIPTRTALSDRLRKDYEDIKQNS